MEIPEIVNGEKYNLKWNKHHNIIATNVLEHLSEEELVDVTLTCEGKFIKAHKLILSASSEYFKELFQRHRGQNPIIIMTNIKFEYLKYIIDYIYKGEIRLLSSEIQGILKLANELQIKGLNGILNKNFQHFTDMKHDKKPTPKNKKTDIREEKCHEKPIVEAKKPVGTFSTFKIIIDNEEQTRPKRQVMNANEVGEDDSTLKQNRTKKRKTFENKMKPMQELDISTAFRSILPQPVDSAEAKSPSLGPEIGTISFSSSTCSSEANTVPTNTMSVPLLVPLTSEDPPDSSIQTVPYSIESPGVSSEVIESNEIPNLSVPKTEEPFQEYLEGSETNMQDKIDTVESSTNVKDKTNAPDGTKTPAVKQISAFMLFTDEYRPIISLEYPDESVKQISLRLSCMWKNLSNKKKDSYYEEASRENEKRKWKMKK